MNRTPDLDAALSFVIHRIEEQARQSGEPLSKEQHLLLNTLPSPMPQSAVWLWFGEPEPPPLIPRNFDYERICALGKAARLNDLVLNPSTLDWDFACAVFHLNNHPMWGLLQQAGVKYRRPLWDQFLLIIASLLYIAAMMAIIPFRGDEPWTPFQWVRVISGIGVLAFLTNFASRRIEKWQLEKRIERCRLASRFVNITAG